MNGPERRQQLLALKAQLAQEYAAKVTAEEPPADLGPLETRMTRVDRALSTLAPDYWTRLRPVILVGLFVVIAATVLLSWRASFLPVVLDISARTVSLESESPTRIEVVSFDGSAAMRGIDWISSPRVPSLEESNESVEMAELEGTWLRLDQLSIPAGATLELQFNTGVLSTSVSGGESLEGAFQLDKQWKLITQAGDFSFDLADPEAVRFGTFNGEDGPRASRTVEIDGQLLADTTFSFEVQPTSLRFVERIADGSDGREFASSVIGGTISIPSMGQTLTLEQGEAVDIEDLSAEMARVTVGDQVHIRLRGTAGDIRLGSGKFARHVAPTMLEYLAKNHILTLLWGLAGTVGGLLWSIVRFFKT